MEEQLKAVFEKADKDGNGFLTINEIRKLLEEIKTETIPEAAVDYVLKKLDLNSDGKVSCEGNFFFFQNQKMILIPFSFQNSLKELPK